MEDPSVNTKIMLARQLARLFSKLPQVEAIALGGSLAASNPASPGEGFTHSAEDRFTPVDAASDIDLYVYTRAAIPLASRREIMLSSGGATQANLGLEYFGPGDEWFDAQTGIEVDMVYFDAGWMEKQLQNVLLQHQPAAGYTTCFWHTIRRSLPLYDPNRWFATQQTLAAMPYPPQLAQAIVTYNHPLLRGIIPSFAFQIHKAVSRRDLPSLNHRLAALLASYFDILYAVNGLPHPGEKRMAQTLRRLGAQVPIDLESDLSALLLIRPEELDQIPQRLTTLLDNLDGFLAAADWPGRQAFSMPAPDSLDGQA